MDIIQTAREQWIDNQHVGHVFNDELNANNCQLQEN